MIRWPMSPQASAGVAPGEDDKPSEQAEQAAVHDFLTTNVQVEGLDPSYTGTTAMAIVPLPLPPGPEPGRC
jgi:hypothetical protein